MLSLPSPLRDWTIYISQSMLILGNRIPNLHYCVHCYHMVHSYDSFRCTHESISLSFPTYPSCRSSSSASSRRLHSLQKEHVLLGKSLPIHSASSQERTRTARLLTHHLPLIFFHRDHLLYSYFFDISCLLWIISFYRDIFSPVFSEIFLLFFFSLY